LGEEDQRDREQQSGKDDTGGEPFVEDAKSDEIC